MNENISEAYQFIYAENEDKQRIVIVGEGAHTIFAMVKHVLKHQNKKADYISNDQLDNFTSLTFSDAPVLIVVNPNPTAALLALKAHVLIVSNVLAKSDLTGLYALAEALPKSGILIADDRAPLTTLTKNERADVLTFLYKPYAHHVENGNVNLITSKDEKFPVKISGEENLRNISAAKEMLKRIGVSSGQFYRAIATFTL